MCSGDHTVKIICCRTGQCLKVLSGHRRTPWVVSRIYLAVKVVVVMLASYLEKNKGACPSVIT